MGATLSIIDQRRQDHNHNHNADHFSFFFFLFNLSTRKVQNFGVCDHNLNRNFVSKNYVGYWLLTDECRFQ